MIINLFGDAEFQLNQIKDILFPAMEKKSPIAQSALLQIVLRLYLERNYVGFLFSFQSY